MSSTEIGNRFNDGTTGVRNFEETEVQYFQGQYKVYNVPGYSSKFTNTGVIDVISADLAGDFQTKRPVEYSFNRGEAAQLEIGVVQFDRFEVEEKTPEATLNGSANVPDEATLNGDADVPDEAALNGERNMSDEAFDECDEDLLEHAMTSRARNEFWSPKIKTTIVNVSMRVSREFRGDLADLSRDEVCVVTQEEDKTISKEDKATSNRL